MQSHFGNVTNPISDRQEDNTFFWEIVFGTGITVTVIILCAFAAMLTIRREGYDPISDENENHHRRDDDEGQRPVVVLSVGTSNPSSAPPPNPYSRHDEEDPNNVEDGDDDDNEDDNDDDDEDDHESAPDSTGDTNSNKLKKYNLLTFDNKSTVVVSEEVKISIKEERKQSAPFLSMVAVD